MKQYKYNIEDFRIGEYENGYQKYLIFLIRYLFAAPDFNGVITRKDFLKRGEEKGFSPQMLSQVFQRGSTNNPSLRKKLYHNQKVAFLVVSVLDKKKQGSLLVYLSPKIISKVSNISDFRSLCYIIIASRVYFHNDKVSKVEYIQKIPGRSLTTIGRSFGNASKYTMSKRLHTAHEKYKNLFNITHKFDTYGDYLIQLPNIYSLLGVRYVYRKNTNYTWERKKSPPLPPLFSRQAISSQKLYPVDPLFIQKRKVFLGEHPTWPLRFLSDEDRKLIQNH